mgnify:FL=1|tara:strand:+ start:267 stop:536 length:270 start_codon:yes stop_codon:yes gene_type:complete
MFANLLPFRRRPTPSPELAFVRDVNVNRSVGRNSRSEFWIVLGWVLIGLKTWGTFWLVERYAMPFNAWWIVLPTYLCAAVCTWIYWRRN